MNDSESILAALGNAGWRIYPTGGNCEALRFDYPDRFSAWITDADGPMIPQSWDTPCVLAFYRSDEEEARIEFRCSGVREATEIAGTRIVLR